MKTKITCTVLVALNLIAYAICLAFLPEIVPIHIGPDMKVDGVGTAWVFIFLPAFALLFCVLSFFENFLQKKQPNRKYATLIFLGMSAFFIYMGWLFFAVAMSGLELGEKFSLSFALLILFPMSVLFMLMGNYLPRIKKNATLGIKTYATLHDEVVWVKVHRLGGLMMFISGLISAICAVVFSLLQLDYIALIIFFATILTAAFTPMIYGGILYRKLHQKTKESE